MASRSADRHNDTAPTRSPWEYLGRLRRGQILSLDFFRRHWGVIAVVMTFLLLYITNKYYCQTSMEQIRSLNRELELVKTERVRAKSIYMSRTRESSMQQLIDSLGLGLSVQTRPPFKIIDEQ